MLTVAGVDVPSSHGIVTPANYIYLLPYLLHLGGFRQPYTLGAPLPRCWSAR